MIPASPLMLRDGATIARLLLERRTPSTCAFREVMEKGALMSYGVNLVDVFRDAAASWIRLLKGVRQATFQWEHPRISTPRSTSRPRRHSVS